MLFRSIEFNTFYFIGIVSFEPIGCSRFNCGLGSLATLYFNFPIGISICAGIFAVGICDFVTFVESINASGNRFARFCKWIIFWTSNSDCFVCVGGWVGVCVGGGGGVKMRKR